MARAEYAMGTDELQYPQGPLVVTAATADIDVGDAPTTLACAFRERFDDRRVRDILGGAASDIGQRIKLLSPRLRHRGRIGKVLLVERFDIRRVGTVEEGRHLEFSHHDGCLFGQCK